MTNPDPTHSGDPVAPTHEGGQLVSLDRRRGMADFLGTVWDGIDEGWLTGLAIFHDGRDPITIWRPAGEIDALVDDLAPYVGAGNIYFGVASRKERLGWNRRGGKADCLALPGLFADIDVAGPGHKSDRTLAPDYKRVLALLGLPDTANNERTPADVPWRFPLLPTLVVWTGGGFHPYWLLQEPAAVDDVALLNRRLWAHLSRCAAADGWEIDDVQNVDRVLRVAGTPNVKPGVVPQDAVVIWRDGPRYNLDDFDVLDELPEADVTVRARQPAEPYNGPERPGDALNRLVGCEDLLVQIGWTVTKTDRAGNVYLAHPKATYPWSGVVYADDGHFACYSSSEPNGLRREHPYDAFGIYATAMHGGDFEAATRSLAAAGLGEQRGGYAEDFAQLWQRLVDGAAVKVQATPSIRPAWDELVSARNDPLHSAAPQQPATGAQEAADGDPDREHGWECVDLAGIVSGDHQRPRPGLLRRTTT